MSKLITKHKQDNIKFSDDVEFDEKSEEFVKLLLVPELSKN
jgi:hypothetical protein